VDFLARLEYPSVRAVQLRLAFFVYGPASWCQNPYPPAALIVMLPAFSSFQLLSRDFSFRHDGGEGGRSKREKEGEEAGKHAQLINGLPRS
jgi:hypothetical protein